MQSMASTEDSISLVSKFDDIDYIDILMEHNDILPDEIFEKSLRSWHHNNIQYQYLYIIFSIRVILHKKFIAIKIVAFIIASSGVIINIYINADLMWSKVLVTTSATAFAFVIVINKHIKS